MTHTDDETQVFRGSDNVFADLGLSHPEERLRKADLACELAKVIRLQGITQKEAASILGITQSQVSDVLRGRLKHFSIERLIRLLEQMGCQVEIKVINIAEHPRHNWNNGNGQEPIAL